MNMMEAVVSVFKNWKDFRGRACRSEFWYFYLATSILYIVFYFVDPATSPFEVPEGVPGLGMLTNLITLILLLWTSLLLMPILESLNPVNFKSLSLSSCPIKLGSTRGIYQ